MAHISQERPFVASGASVLNRALITGITGQDGSYLADLLLSKGYRVAGLVRRSSSAVRPNIEHIRDRVPLFYGDLQDSASLNRVVKDWQPTEVYNLAAQSHVRVSFDVPEYTADVDGVGVVRLLDAVRQHAPDALFYQASTSEMFGGACLESLNESSPFNPQSPYGCAKVFAHHSVKNAREGYGMFACSGILFNHESPRRSPAFVTRKVTMAAARIARGLQDELVLGNIEAMRDWGFAGDYVEAMWRMLQASTPQDYVIATGVVHTITDLLDMAFGEVDLDWHRYVKHDVQLQRPTEVHALLGNPLKAERELGWYPTVTFPEIIKMMVRSDLERR